jgi:hypothetical protein
MMDPTSISSSALRNACSALVDPRFTIVTFFPDTAIAAAQLSLVYKKKNSLAHYQRNCPHFNILALKASYLEPSGYIMFVT